KVSQALRSLPEDLDAPPVVSKADADANRIIAMTVQSNTRNILELSDYAENVISQRIETIAGVSGVQIWGQRRHAKSLWIDPMKLASYGCTVADVRAALLAQNIELPSGKLTGHATELSLKTLGLLKAEEEFNSIIILAGGEKLVQLRDIGGASLEGENMDTEMSDSGQPMVAV